jgi:Relaxase/Mobilisation nuclease domain
MRPFRLERSGEPLLDIGSYARRSFQSQVHLTPAQVEHIRRTVTRTPEVMVKVTGGGANSSGGVKAHFGYISRRGELEIETDDGEHLKGRGAGLRLLNDWDLDLEQDRKRPDLFATNRRQAPKLVHKLIFSMPAGTPADKVLAAVQIFAREEFGLKHRYAMVLHTDEPHPHVHVVVKAISEDGVRLNIRKATLRDWRREFARHLRERGIAANATERAVRGETKTRKIDGIYRAVLRGASTHVQGRIKEVATYLAEGRIPAETGKATLTDTRRKVEQGWREVIMLLESQGEQRLAASANRFIEAMHPPRTEREAIVEQLLKHARQARRVIEPTR